MINDIIEAISATLYKVFGFKIYADNVEQDLETPCFLITNDSLSRSALLGNRAKHDQLFDIHFFPSEGDEQIRDVAFKLVTNLDPLTLLNGDKIHGLNIRTETVDDVLHCFVNYNELVQDEITEEDYMETIETKGAVMNV